MRARLLSFRCCCVKSRQVGVRKPELIAQCSDSAVQGHFRSEVLSRDIENESQPGRHALAIDVGRRAVRNLRTPVNLGLDGARADVVVEAQHSWECFAGDSDVPLGRRLVGVGVHDRVGRAAPVGPPGGEVLAVVVPQDDLADLPTLQRSRQLGDVTEVSEAVSEDALAERHPLKGDRLSTPQRAMRVWG